jgi:DNA-binding beta-propeller fold protein YncE
LVFARLYFCLPLAASKSFQPQQPAIGPEAKTPPQFRTALADLHTASALACIRLSAKAHNAYLAPIFRHALSSLSRAVVIAVMSVLFCFLTQAQTAHFGGVQSTVPTSGLDIPYGVAVDGSGNVYIADTYNNRVLKETFSAGNYTESTIGSGLNAPAGIAVDGSGNVYVSGDDQVVKETLSGGSYTQSTVASGLDTPIGVAVDGNRNVYIVETTNNQVLKETPSTGTYIQSIVSTSSLFYPRGVAVDGSGNLYITDTDNNRVLKETLSAGSYTESTIVSGLNNPQGVAVDRSGNVYIADTGNKRVLKETSSAGSYTQSVVTSSGLNYPSGIAVDGSGAVYIADEGTNQVLKEVASAADFGKVNVGSPSSVITLIFAFDTAGAIGTPAVLTQGVAGLDFADAGTGTCTTNGTSHTYSIGDTCTVDVTFTPKASGSRYGAVELLDNSGNMIATGYVQGTGVGPQVNFLPGAESTVADWESNGLLWPQGVAVDASGNVYIADSNHNRVLKETPSAGGYTQSTVPTGSLNYPNQVAVDGGGNIYIADTTNFRILKETLSAGGYSESTVASFPPIDGTAPVGVAVDGSGNVYISSSAGSLYKETLTAGSYTQSTIPTGISSIGEIAVDGSGNVYLADNSSNNQIVKETLSATGYTQSTVPISGLGVPYGIAVDGSGNLYISYIPTTGTSLVLKETLSGGSYTQSTIPTSALNQPFGVAVDGSGNVYIADSGNSRVLKEDFADPPSLKFATTAYGLTSTDSPQTVTVSNVGNAPLTFPVPSSGNNPSIATNFSLDGSTASACPQLESGSSAPGTLPAGAFCVLPISFTPAAVGALSGSLVLTDNNLNTAAPGYAMQSISLSGIGTQATPTITWATPAAITYGMALNAAQLDATASVPGTFSYSSPAGTVLGAGSHQLTATFTPTDGIDYTTATGSIILVVNQAAPTITWTTSVAITYGTALSATQLNANSPVAGTFSYSPPAGTLLGGGSHQLTVTFTPTDAIDYTAATGSIILVVNQATPTITWKTPIAITYGTALSTTQLNANSPVAGTFSYSPPAGTLLGGGSQTLSVKFTPSDSTDYATATATTTITVNQATPTVAWPAPPAITYGTNLGAILDPRAQNGSATIPGTFAFTATPTGGTAIAVTSATILEAGNYELTAAFTPTNISDYTVANASAVLTVGKAASVVSLGSSANAGFLSNAVIFPATVSSSVGTPTGTVSFYDGTTLLGPVALVSGVATYTTSALATGAHSITAVYSGDSNFSTETSSAAAENIQDFTISSSSGTTSATVSPGGQATYPLVISPLDGATLPGAVTLTVSGLPSGASATFTPSTLAANSGTTDVKLTLTLPGQAAALPLKIPFRRGPAPLSLGLILLPFAGRMRRASRRLKGARLKSMICLLVLALAALTSLVGLTGCGGGAGSTLTATSPTPTSQSYTLTVVATSGSLSHSIPVTLTVD